MHAETIMRKFRILMFIIPALALSGCGQGEGTERIANTPATPLPPLPTGFCDAINFEIRCPPTAFFGFASGVPTVIDNPDMSGINDSDKVLQFQKFPNPTEFFGGVRFDLSDAVDFANGQSFSFKAWSSRPVPITFKLEETNDGTLGVEKVRGHSGSGMWEELCYDFTGETLTVIAYSMLFDNGVQGQADVDPDNWTFFIDDIAQVESCPAGAPTMLPVDFENDPFEYEFREGGGFEGGQASVVANPDPSGINPSAQVAQMLKFPVAVPENTFGGATLSLDVTADVEAGSSFRMKVWSQRQVPVLLQPEPQGPGSGLEVLHTGTGWEELTFPLPALAGIVDGITVIFDVTVMGDAGNNPDDWTFYFDDIALDPPDGGGGGGGGGADAGVTPEFVLFGTSAAADVAIPDFIQDVAGPQNFGSGATFDFEFADSSFDPVIAVTAGNGYGPDTWVAFLAVNGYANPIAVGYDTFNVKVKGSPLGNIEVKLIGGGDDSVFALSLIHI